MEELEEEEEEITAEGLRDPSGLNVFGRSSFEVNILIGGLVI